MTEMHDNVQVLIRYMFQFIYRSYTSYIYIYIYIYSGWEDMSVVAIDHNANWTTEQRIQTGDLRVTDEFRRMRPIHIYIYIHI